MSDYLDKEAEESDDEEELDEVERKRLKKIRDESEDEEDDEEQYAEELRDFIADTNVDSEESEGEGVVRRRKRTSGEREELDDQLEDDDYDLLEENLGIKVQRQKKFRRVRVEEESDEEQEAMEESAASVMVDAAAEASDEEATREDLDLTNEQDEERARRSGGSDQEDELDDFIVDEEGNPVRDKRKKVKRNHIPDSALQDAQDIFGVEFDYDDMEQVSGEEGGDEEGVEGEEDEYYSDEEREEGEDGDRSSPARKKRRVGKKGWRRKVPKTTIFDLFEPADLERNHFTDLDNDLRNSDIPERMQIRNFPVTPADAQDGDRELEEESEWIYRNAFSVMPVSKQTIRPEASMKESKLVQPILGASTTSRKIKNALEFMRNMYLEVPFIANYRKEYVEGLTSNDLWRIYDFDEKWCQLKSRKEKLCELMQSMMTYQQDMCVERSDEPLPEDFRAVCVTDVQRTMQAETPEEFNDAYSQFLMYYSHEVPNMHDYRRRKRTEQRRKEREALQAERLQKKHTKTVIVSKTVVNDDTGEMTTVDVAEEVTDDERVMEEKEKEVVEEDEEEEEEPEQLKAPARRHPYNLCRRAGLAGFASLFGLAPDRFAENVRDEYARHEPESSPVEPLEAAKQYVCAQFPQVEDVVKAATLMVAHQLAAEPDVRRAIRTKVYNGATVNVRPTKKGFREIDENHALYRYKYLNGKAVSSLENELFLVLEGGEKDGLITLELNCDVLNKDGVRLSEEVETLYVQDGFAQYVKSWNEVRRNTIRQMFARILIPLMEKELRRRLGDEAREHVVLSAARKLYDSIKVAPYRPPDAKDDDDENWDCTAGIRVLGLSYVANEPDLAAFAVVIDMNAEVLDKLRLPAIMRGRGRQNQVPEKKANAVQHTFANDLQNLRQLIIKHKPHVVAMAAESRAAQQLGSELETVLAELRTSHGFPEVTVEFVDNSLAKIYGNSLRGAEEFPEYPMVLRQAVSLARRIQNPLLEFAQLCTFDDEILCVPWHSMQDQGGRDALLAALQHEFITRVNNVGVDLNECAASPYVAQVLQFVCGLGPRKAAAVLKTLRQKTIRMENRTQLVTQLHMGPRLFMNVAGFIRIDTNSLGDSADNYVELLDSTRVHPETYEWARKMAIDALEYDEVGYDANPGAALEEILESPDRLKDLDLEAFAVELERQGYGNKKITLPDIRVELTNRYADHREEYKSPGEDELFAWFTKETPDTLHPGRLQLGHVVGIAHRKHNARGDDLQQQQQPTRLDSGLWRCQFCLRSDFPELSEVWTHLDLGQCPGRAVGVRLRLENGIPGFIPIKNLSDSEVLNPMDRVYVGMVIQVRITKILVDKISVECTCRSSDLQDLSETWRPQKDKYYDYEQERADRHRDESQRKAAHRRKHAYTTRVIVHPNFLNVDYAGAEALMKNKQQGDVVIRPSSQGSDHLTVTWKVTDGVHQHIDVKEKDKENAFSLGKSLWIGTEEFEDLDEIVARYVAPMAAHARDILSYKYYRDTEGGNRELAEDILREEKRKAPNKIPYILSVVAQAHGTPGRFMLSYQPRLKARHEFVSVTPEGFRYRKQSFDSLNAMLKWFKEHHREPVPNTPGVPSVAQSVRTPGAFSLASVSRDAIRQAAQNIPAHIYSALTKVAQGGQTPHTPHYPHTPHTPYTHYTQTPYTPSGQTPYLTPYSTPRHGTQHPSQSQRVTTAAAAPAPSSVSVPSSFDRHSQSKYNPSGWTGGASHQRQGDNQRRPSYYTSSSSGGGGGGQSQVRQQQQQQPHRQQQQQQQQRVAGGNSRMHPQVTSHDPNHWHQAASAWAHRASKPPGSRTPRTPAYEDRGPSTPVAAPAYDDGTPLYDE